MLVLSNSENSTDETLVLVNWADNTRDVLNLLINFMPELPGEILNTHLPAISVDISKRRQISGFPHRKILGLGHSLGGACVYVQ